MMYSSLFHILCGHCHDLPWLIMWTCFMLSRSNVLCRVYLLNQKTCAHQFSRQFPIQGQGSGNLATDRNKQELHAAQNVCGQLRHP